MARKLGTKAITNDAITADKIVAGAVVADIGAGAVTALLNMGPEETVSEIMDRGEGLDVESIRAEVIEAFKDPSGDKLAA